MIKTVSPDRLYVVEVGDEIFVGRISIVGNVAFIYNGFTGRPPVVALEDIDELTVAEQHPDVEVLEYDNAMLDEMDERLSALEESLDSINTIVELQGTAIADAVQDEEVFTLLA